MPPLYLVREQSIEVNLLSPLHTHLIEETLSVLKAGTMNDKTEWDSSKTAWALLALVH